MVMSAQEVIEQIKHLPPAERAQVAKFVVENDDSWIPTEFERGEAAAASAYICNRLKPTERFWESFYDLTASQKESTRRAWRSFKRNPFDPRLRAHKIHRLSARYGRTICAVDIEGDLRVVFYIEGNLVVT